MSRVDRATRFRVLHEAGFRCRYCGRQPPDVVLEVDHVQPRSAGGTNQRRNLVAACFDCNRGKRATVLQPLAGLVSAHLQACGDSCFKGCQIGAITLPVAMVDEGDGVTLSYRCQGGHEWQTWWATETAAVHAAGCAELPARCWPTLVKG